MSDEEILKKIADLEAELDQARAQTQSMGQLLENKLNEIYIHYHISRTISSVLDIQEMLLQIAGIIKKTIPFERMSLYLVGENRETLELSYFSGLDIKQKIILDRGAGTPGGIVESGDSDWNLVSGNLCVGMSEPVTVVGRNSRAEGNLM